MEYEIKQNYIKHGKARSGEKLIGPIFGVAHDTGNPGSTARANRNYFDKQQPSASAHTFIDDKEILEIIPITEKAWHVQYNKTKDNELFGEDANDAAIGVELCWGEQIDFTEAYKRYVWYWAYLCKKFNWDPFKKIVSHKELDPQRRSDPENVLKRYGITWEKFLQDVFEKVKGDESLEQNVSDWAKDAWKWVKENGISDGDRPKDIATREEIWTIVYRLKNLK